MMINCSSLRIALFFTALLFAIGQSHERFYSTSDKPVSQKSLILILPGLGSSPHKVNRLAGTFRSDSSDVLCADIIDRNSMEKSSQRLTELISDYTIDHYKSVSVYGFILGGAVFSFTMNRNLLPNLTAVVYDRSPYQERAPRIAVEKYPRLLRLVIGPVLEEFAEMGYVSLACDSIPVGFLIETKMTSFVKRNRVRAQAIGPFDFDPQHWNHPVSDFLYLPLDHTDMYRQSPVYRDEMVRFFTSHSFSDTAHRDLPFRE